MNNLSSNLWKDNLNFFQISFKSVESKGKGIKIKGFASTPAVDRGLDVVTPQAFTHIDEDMKELKILLMHNPDKPIGIPTSYEVKPEWLYIEADILNDTDWVFEMIMNKTITWFSIWYYVNKANFYEKEIDGEIQTIREITDIRLVEISCVAVPMNMGAVFTLSKSLKKLFTPKTLEISNEKGEKWYNVSEDNKDSVGAKQTPIHGECSNNTMECTEKKDVVVNINVDVDTEETDTEIDVENSTGKEAGNETDTEVDKEANQMSPQNANQSENQSVMTPPIMTEGQVAIIKGIELFMDEKGLNILKFTELLDWIMTTVSEVKQIKALELENKDSFLKTISQHKDATVEKVASLESKIKKLESELLSIKVPVWNKTDPTSNILLNNYLQQW